MNCKKKTDPVVAEFLDYCQDGVIQLVKKLFDENQNPKFLLEAKDLDQCTCFHKVALYGHTELLQFLLEKAKQLNIQVDLPDKNKFTPLLNACFRGYDQNEEIADEDRYQCVKLLVESGSSISYQKPVTKLTALHWAAFNNDRLVIQYLLQQGALLQYSGYDQTPLDTAGIVMSIDAIDEILKFWWNQEKNYSNNGDSQISNKQEVKDQSHEQLLQTKKGNQVSVYPADQEAAGPGECRILYSKNHVSHDSHKLKFRILHWAAFIGRKDIVQYIIKQGYSPFVKVVNKKNALMAAVEGGQTETVKMIIGYNFQSDDKRMLEKSKKCKDEAGNTALHIAYKNLQGDIPKILLDNNMGDKIKRNLRGLIPEQMNHKKVALDKIDCDPDPDYLFVVKKNRAEFLKLQLKELNLEVKEFQSIQNDDQMVFIIYFPDDILDQMAELEELPVRLLDYNQVLPYKNYADDLYEAFQSRQKQFLMLKIFDQEIDLDYYQKVGIIIDHFPLHDNYRHQINESWMKYRTKLFFGFLFGGYLKYMQPLNFIANYYGEKMGFYYAWLMFYTSWLLIPAIPGIVLFIYQMYRLGTDFHADKNKVSSVAITSSIDNIWNLLYCIFLALWSTIMTEMWKRRQNEIAHIWNMKEYVGNDTEREDFKYEMIIDNKSKDQKKQSFINSYMRRIFLEIPTVIFSIACVVGVYIGYQIFQEEHKSGVANILSVVVYTCILVIFGVIYKSIASILANWENHRFQQEWENSLVTKIFAFQFVNAYIALFAVAFARQEFNQLSLNLAIILCGKQFGFNLVETFLPMMIIGYKKMQIKKLFRKNFPGKPSIEEDVKLLQDVEEQRILSRESNVLVFKYSEIVIQYGYIVLFANAFPLAPLLSILCNFIEMKSNMNLMSFYSCRFQAQGAANIGAWQGIVEMLSFGSIIVNLAIAYFTSQALDSWHATKDITETSRLLIVILVEHIIIGLKILIATMIKDVPDWVTKEEHEQDQNLTELYKLLDEKADEYQQRGGKLLDEQIRQMRKDQIVKSGQNTANNFAAGKSPEVSAARTKKRKTVVRLRNLMHNDDKEKTLVSSKSNKNLKADLIMHKIQANESLSHRKGINNNLQDCIVEDEMVEMKTGDVTQKSKKY